MKRSRSSSLSNSPVHGPPGFLPAKFSYFAPEPSGGASKRPAFQRDVGRTAGPPVPPSTAERFPPKGAYDEIVHVKVGKNPDTKTFQLHKGVLSFYSGYFAGLFRSDLAEAASGEITLEDEEVEVFDQFVVWLYSRQVASQESASFHQFVKLWLFADRRIVPLLKNSTLGAIRDKLLVEWQPQLHNLGLVYEHSAKGSGLRRFLIDFVAWTGSNGTVDRIVNECSKEVVADILRAVWSRPLPRKMSADEFRTLNLCPYHDHEDGVRCRHDHEEGMRYRHDHEEAMRYRHDHEEAMRCRHDHERCR